MRRRYIMTRPLSLPFGPRRDNIPVARIIPFSESIVAEEEIDSIVEESEEEMYTYASEVAACASQLTHALQNFKNRIDQSVVRDSFFELYINLMQRFDALVASQENYPLHVQHDNLLDLGDSLNQAVNRLDFRESSPESPPPSPPISPTTPSSPSDSYWDSDE